MLLFLPFLSSESRAGDWPMYRADSARSGYTAESLPEELSLIWIYEAPQKPTPAWPDAHWQKMTFDFAYQPVVAGGTVYYGSSVDCAVHALDAGTGQPRWRFTTDGPVRFAPAVWRDRLLAASDDGYLYCLAAADGTLLWKLRGGPSTRKIVGNGRVISMFPARAGPVVHDDVVYFGAGLFPTQGFFLYAVEPESGRVLWRNETSGNTRLYQYNHGFCFSNVAGHGYLAVAGDTLLVSTGRSIPAAYRRSDGRWLYYNPLEVYRTGGAWTMVAADHFFCGDMAFRVETGEVACPEMGTDPDRGTSTDRSPMLRDVTMIEGAVAPDSILVANGREIRALDRQEPFVDDPKITKKWCTSRTAAFFAGGPRARLSQHLQGAKLQWTATLPCRCALIVAGDRAFAGDDGVVHALNLKTKKVTLIAEVEGKVYGLAVADGRLYASTDEGRIYCLGAAKGSPAVISQRSDAELYPDNKRYEKAADQILEKAGLKEGYCVDLGCGEGRLSYALAGRSNLRIYAVDTDAANVATARRKLTAAGLYGSRVTVHQLDPIDTGYPVYFANLIVSGQSVTHGPNGAWEAEVERLQRPWGGAACVGRPDQMEVDVRGSLVGAGQWTHAFGSAANTGASIDSLARSPLAVHWFGTSGPEGMLGGKQRTSPPLFAGGRLYIPGGRFLRCLDAYNGRIMWENHDYQDRDGRHYAGAHTKGSNICAVEDRVYFLSNRGECVCLDGETGKELVRFSAPAAADSTSGEWGFLAFDEGTIFGTLESGPLDSVFEDYCRALGQEYAIFKTPWHWHTEGKTFFAMDAESGRLRWTYRPENLIPHNGIAIGGGRVYLLDRPHLSLEMAKARRRGAESPPGMAAGSIVALDAKTGKELWRCDEDIFGSLLTLSTEHQALVLGFPIMRRGNFASDLFTRLAVHRVADGRRLWQRDVQYHQRPLVIGRKVVIDPGGFDWTTGRKSLVDLAPCAFDLLTGEPVMRSNPVTGRQEPWIFGRTEKCPGWTGSPNLLLFRTGTVSYYDFLRDEGRSDVGGIRQSCYINLFAAGGLVLMPDNSSGCTCSYLHRTSIALQPIERQEHWGLYMGCPPTPGIVEHLALNIGAIGDRRAPDGTLWLALPRPAMGRTTASKVDNRALLLGSDSVAIEWLGPAGKAIERRAGLRPFEREPLSWPGGYSDTFRPETLYQYNADATPIDATDISWLFTSGNKGPIRLRVNVSRMPEAATYRIRLLFAEPEDVAPGQRVFDVLINEQTAFASFDVAHEAGATRAAIVEEFQARGRDGLLTITLSPKKGDPILSGVQIKAVR